MTVERRRHPRFKVRVPVDLRIENTDAPMRVETSDLSLGGCYIEMLFTLPVNARTGMTLQLSDATVLVIGRIATCDPGVGNGIEFEKMLFEDHEALMHYLEVVKLREESSESSKS